MQVLYELSEVIRARKAHFEEGSYTSYLFKSGLDKILKKVGEEAAETIIAAKNGDNALLTEEICDLLFHLLVLLEAKDLDLQAVEAQLTVRRAKQGNLKPVTKSDKNS